MKKEVEMFDWESKIGLWCRKGVLKIIFGDKVVIFIKGGKIFIDGF